MTITIFSHPSALLGRIEEIRRGADRERASLGFLGETVYRQQARQGKLLLALDGTDQQRSTYAGHLMFGGRWPNAKVFQIYVEPAFRGRGIARRLLGDLLERLTNEGWISVQAAVADDLEANKFWDRAGFATVRSRPGGESRKRRINIRALALDTPDLFRISAASGRGFQLLERIQNRSPLYFIDLNVLFDRTRQRRGTVAATSLFKAAWRNDLRLAMTREATRELERTSKGRDTDPILEMVRDVLVVEEDLQDSDKSIQDTLSELIFPDAIRQGHLRIQDLSDIRHLIIASKCGAAGFITAEDAILSRRSEIMKEIGLEVIGTEELYESLPKENTGTSQLVELSGSGLFWERLTGLKAKSAAEALLSFGYSSSEIRQITLDVTESSFSLTLKEKDTVIGTVLSNEFRTMYRRAQVFIGVDEGHPFTERIVDFLLQNTVQTITSASTAVVALRLSIGSEVARRIAQSHGFMPPKGLNQPSQFLEKLCIGRPVGTAEWPQLRKVVLDVAGVTLPIAAPAYVSPDQPIPIVLNNGDHESVKLKDLEWILGPVLFLFDSRPGVVVPIWRSFAEDLIAMGRQPSLLANKEAILHRERFYYCAPAAASAYVPGRIALFYESGRGGGSKEIVSIARIVSKSVLGVSEAWGTARHKGVLSQEMLQTRSKNGKICCVKIDSIIQLNKAVSLKELREIGCVPKQEFITATVISHEHVEKIISRGMRS